MKTSRPPNVGALFALAVLSSPAFGQDASMFRGNPQHTGIYQSAGVPRFHQVQWKFHTNGYVLSTPAISAGVLYVGSTDGNLYAVDIKSGTQKWKFPAGVRITSSPAVAGGLVYFESYSGNFIALDITNGQVKWKHPTGDVVHASPAVANGAVYIGSWDSYFYALDAAMGAERWRFKTGED